VLQVKINNSTHLGSLLLIVTLMISLKNIIVT